MKFRSKMGFHWSERQQVMANMVTSLIEHERIKTTVARAKSVVVLSDRLVTKAKKGGPDQMARCKRWVKTPSSLAKLFTSAHEPSPVPCSPSWVHTHVAFVDAQFLPIAIKAAGAATHAC